MKKSTIDDCLILELPKVKNRAGNISIIEGLKNLPFETKRVFFIYDIPAGESRGAHAHRECHQFIVAASGSFQVEMDDGIEKKTITLSHPFYGIYIPPMIWAHEFNFSSGAICLVFASHKFDEKDYIRNYDTYNLFQ